LAGAVALGLRRCQPRRAVGRLLAQRRVFLLCALRSGQFRVRRLKLTVRQRQHRRLALALRFGLVMNTPQLGPKVSGVALDLDSARLRAGRARSP
jgi:hypothetical protein